VPSAGRLRPNRCVPPGLAGPTSRLRRRGAGYPAELHLCNPGV